MAGRRCGYAFSYDEYCGRLVAESMQVFTSTESLADERAQSAAARRGAGVELDSVWCSGSDVDVDRLNVTVPTTSHRLDVLTE